MIPSVEIFKYLSLPGNKRHVITNKDKELLAIKLMFGCARKFNTEELFKSLQHDGLIYTDVYREAVKETVGNLYIKQMLYN